MANTESDPMQLILAELTAIKQSIAQQEERHQDELAELRKDFEERMAALKQSAPSTPRIVVETEGSSVPIDTQRSGSGSSRLLTPPTTVTTAPTVIKSDRLPDPPAFNGKRKDLSAFLRKLRYKLEGNADRFPTERSRLLYAHSRLDRDVVSLIDSLMDKDICTVDQFIGFLEATYGDPNKEMTALSKLSTLKQGKRGFTAHFAEFRRLAADTSLNEIGLIASLRNSLSPDLQRAMVGESLPSDLNSYANLISTYDNNMQFLPAPVPTPYRTRTAQASRRDPDAMEIDSNYAPAGSKEREDRIKRGLCFKCGKHGHISRDCSIPLPRTRLSSVPASSRSVTPPTRSRESFDSTASPRNSPRRSRRSRSRSQNSLRKDSSRR